MKTLLQCRVILFLLALLPAAPAFAVGTQVFVSVAAQELGVVKNGKTISRYPVSTSKFGVGDASGRYRTPLGTFFVLAKIGDNRPPGAVIKSRLPTREIVAVNSPGRDAIVSRVIGCAGKKPATATPTTAASTSTARRKRKASDGGPVSAVSGCDRKM